MTCDCSISHRNVAIATKNLNVSIEIPRSPDDGYTDELTFTNVEGFPVTQNESKTVNAAYSVTTFYDRSSKSICSTADFAFCSYSDNTLEMVATPFTTDPSWLSPSESSSSTALYLQDDSADYGLTSSCCNDNRSCFFDSCASCNPNCRAKVYGRYSDSLSVPGYTFSEKLPVKFPWSPQSLDSISYSYPSTCSEDEYYSDSTSPDRQSYRPSNRPSAAAARRSPEAKNAGQRSSERPALASRSPSRENPLKRSPDRLNLGRKSPDQKNLGRQLPDRQNLDRQSPDRQNPVRRRSSERKIGGQRSPERRRNRDKDVGRSSRQQRKVVDSSDNSESDSNDLEMDRQPPGFPIVGGRKRGSGLVIPAEGAYDPKHFQDLKVSTDMENIFQYIMKYTPQKVDIEFKLQPFIPDYVPAVGDIDPFIKVTTPASAVKGTPLSDNFLEYIDNLGLTVLDEPSAEQSDSALLHLQLRAFSKSNSAKSTVVHSILYLTLIIGPVQHQF